MVDKVFFGHEKKNGEEILSITEECSTLEGEKNHFIAIVSGKGGVGKTTISANLGVALSKLGKQVVLIDMDLAMPNLEIITGLHNMPIGLVDVLEGRFELERAVYTGPMGMKVLPPGVMLEGYSQENIEKINRLFNEFPLKSDYVILDMPTGKEAIEVLSENMEALLVVNPNKAAVQDALNMKVLLDKKRVKILGVILNRAEIGDGPWIKEIERLLETCVVSVIQESRMVKESLNDEECFVVSSALSAPSEEINELAEELLKIYLPILFIIGFFLFV